MLSASVCQRCWHSRRGTAGQRTVLPHLKPLRAGYATTTPSEHPPLETAEDWSVMQINRANQKTLIDHLSQFGSTQTRENTWQPHHSLHKPPSPHELTLSALLAAGAHLGHATSLMNPNFIPYTYGTRSGVTVIDLEHTAPLLRRAAQVLRAIAARGGSVVFVGTRTNIRPVVKKAAERMGQHGFYVGEKWLAGTLTNRVQMFGANVALNNKVIPDLVVLLNPIANMTAIRECAIEHVPTIGIIDSNVDPRIVMYPIPANDESQRTAELIAGVLSIAGREGLALWSRKDDKQNKLLQELERAKEKGQRVY